MTYRPRTAFCAVAFLVLGACATTTSDNAANTAETQIGSQVGSQAETRASAILPPPPAVSDTMTEPANTVAPDTESPETLLYGAMTKYELMRFVEAVNAADLASALEGDTELTVFAPNNTAFEYAENKPTGDLASLLKAHIVPGAMDTAALEAAVAETGGSVTLTSLAGTPIKIYVMDGKLKVSGAGGTLATLTQTDMRQSNGVMHQISGVLEP